MLRPRDTSTRERKNLNGLWQFALDQAGEGRSGQWFAGPLPGAREMAVPASFNDIATEATVHDYFGDIWYQTSVWIPRGWQGRRIVLHFESATHRATVWVNNNEVVSHEGGYTPFEADITEHVTGGEQVRITAVVNNTLSFQSIPPGVIEDGVHFGYAVNATPTSISFDRADVQADGLWTNNNPRVRTLPVASGFWPATSGF